MVWWKLALVSVWDVMSRVIWKSVPSPPHVPLSPPLQSGASTGVVMTVSSPRGVDSKCRRRGKSLLTETPFSANSYSSALHSNQRSREGMRMLLHVYSSCLLCDSENGFYRPLRTQMALFERNALKTCHRITKLLIDWSNSVHSAWLQRCRQEC